MVPQTTIIFHYCETVAKYDIFMNNNFVKIGMLKYLIFSALQNRKFIPVLSKENCEKCQRADKLFLKALIVHKRSGT